MDAHRKRIGRAATAYDDYAARLHRLQHRMEQLRGDARAGGLVVSGESIQQPTDAGAVPDLPAGSTPQQAEEHDAKMEAHDAQVAKIELYQRISHDRESAWDTFADCCDADLVDAQADAEQGEGIDSLLGLVQDNLANFGTGVSINFFDGRLEERAEEYQSKADQLRKDRRSGHPGRRARGNAPDAKAKIRDWRSTARVCPSSARRSASPGSPSTSASMTRRSAIPSGC